MTEAETIFHFFSVFLITVLASRVVRNRGRYLTAVTVMFLIESSIFSALLMGIMAAPIEVFLANEIYFIFFIVVLILIPSFLIPSTLALIYFETEELREWMKLRVNGWGKWKMRIGISLGTYLSICFFVIPAAALYAAFFDPVEVISIPRFISGEIEVTMGIVTWMILGFPILGLIFFVFFISGFLSGNELRNTDTSNRIGAIQAVLIIGSLLLVVMEILGISIRWSFLYFPILDIVVLYLGFFFVFQTCIYANTLRKVERKLPSIILLLACVVPILILIENYDTLTSFPVETALHLNLLFVLAFLIGMTFIKRKPIDDWKIGD